LEERKSSAILQNILKYVIPLIISVGLCYLLFTGIDFNEMMDTIRRECNFWWIGLTLFLSIFSHVFRAMRWRIQLRALGIKAPLYALVYSIFGTYAVNLVFPRLGEVWRTGYIAQRQRAQFTTVFGSMLADRLADTVTVLCLTMLAFILASGTVIDYLSLNAEGFDRMWRIATSPWLWLAIVAVAAIAWTVLMRMKDNPVVKKLKSIAKELWDGFAVIASMPGKFQWLVLTFLLWGCYFTQLWVAFYAFDFTANVVNTYGLVAVLVTFVLTSISMGVPSNGGIGPWQYATIWALSIYHVDKLQAAAFGNLVLGSQTLLLIALGIFTFVAIALDRKRTNDKI
jgi:hypothetical protein